MKGIRKVVKIMNRIDGVSRELAERNGPFIWRCMARTSHASCGVVALSVGKVNAMD